MPANADSYIRPLFAALGLLLALPMSQAATNPKLPLPGQVIVDPHNSAHLCYNRDQDRDGRHDPCYLVGPGDPEGFLYLGERQPDGSRSGGRQLAVLQQLQRHGGNVIYFQAVRSNGGDGAKDHNPWRKPDDPTSGLNPAVIRQWRTWFDQMRDAGITMLFFIYDDGVHAFDHGCEAEPSAAERTFVRDLVNSFEDYPNLIWVVQEEFKFVGHQGDYEQRTPCNDARTKRAGRIADLIKEADDHNHVVGVHHNVGDAMAFPDHPSVDVYLQQPNLRVQEKRTSINFMHEVGAPGQGFDLRQRYVYFMSEAYNWHPALCAAGDRTTLRKSYYASALAGGHVAVLGMFPTEEGKDPTDEMLADMRRMQRLFETTNFNEMTPQDDLAYAGTWWVLANRASGSYILYTPEASPTLGVHGLPPGNYRLRWSDPAREITHEQTIRHKGGSASFEKPGTIGAEALLYVRLQR